MILSMTSPITALPFVLLQLAFTPLPIRTENCHVKLATTCTSHPIEIKLHLQVNKFTTATFLIYKTPNQSNFMLF